MTTAPRPWTGIISEDEEKRYEAAGFGRPSGIGTRPALLIIDVQYRTTGTQRVPFYEALKEYKTSCGDVAWGAVDHIVPLLQLFRRQGFPVLYPYVSPKQSFDGGRLAEKVPALMQIPMAGYEFVKEIAPAADDVLLPKKHPSAFFGTPLVSYLVERQIDTLVVTGCTTSGCVRGTVVDGFAYNFKVLVPEECVYDRSPVSHAVNLFDMASKYADVRPVADAMALIQALKPQRAAA
jgi:nicotinamidase-related amidase